MTPKPLRRPALVLLATLGLTAPGQGGRAQEAGAGKPLAIPKTWDDEEIASLQLPLPHPGLSPVHVRADYYYRIPVRPIYKSYPIYHPDKEPPGYLEWLRRQEPEITFDPPELRSEAEWVRAGEIVFDAPIGFASPTAFDNQICSFLEDVRDPEWYRFTRMPLAEGGVLPFFRYVVRKKGLVELGELSCATCHTRVMPDRTVIKGAQGNFPFDRAVAWSFRRRVTPEIVRSAIRQIFTVPGLEPDPLADLLRKPVDEMAALFEAIPPGVLARHGSSPFSPPVVPDLIGIKEFHYLDRTGLVQHRGVEDFMRYAALNQGADDLASFAGFIPAGEDLKKLPAPGTQSRYSDEQLYALAKYLYALEPPPNPNVPKPDDEDGKALVALGRSAIRREMCDRCHRPPLYTNNMLMPVEGFKVPEEHRRDLKLRIMGEAIDTDPGLTLRTRRGTGYYKVPSLKGVWYRGPFGHDGSCATLAVISDN